MCLYINSKLSEKENNFIHSSIKKKNKYLEINFNNQVKDLYKENYMILMEEIKDTQIEKCPVIMNHKN